MRAFFVCTFTIILNLSIVNPFSKYFSHFVGFIDISHYVNYYKTKR